MLLFNKLISSESDNLLTQIDASWLCFGNDNSALLDVIVCSQFKRAREKNEYFVFADSRMTSSKTVGENNKINE